MKSIHSSCIQVKTVALIRVGQESHGNWLLSVTSLPLSVHTTAINESIYSCHTLARDVPAPCWCLMPQSLHQRRATKRCFNRELTTTTASIDETFATTGAWLCLKELSRELRVSLHSYCDGYVLRPTRSVAWASWCWQLYIIYSARCIRAVAVKSLQLTAEKCPYMQMCRLGQYMQQTT